MSNATCRVIVLVLALGVAGCKSSDKQANSPTSPSSPASGTWTGTITRPSGLGTISIQWNAATGTVNGLPGLTGSATLTNGAATFPVTVTGITGGNDQTGYNIFLQFTSKAGDSAAFPNCTVLANSVNQSGDPFPSPYTNISGSLQINYNGCRGFIDTGYSSNLSNSLQETVQLSMHK